ncbi:hypothetical protein Ancab_037238 [Ancistrocladus abbreviatus]
MAEEEEVIMEVEAVQAVYGDDCTVLNRYPPHLHVHIKPRTADVSSQQFVEADIDIRAGSQYPNDPPDIIVIGSKGLDEERLKHLRASLHDKAHELTSYLMLVALCEEAVERLSIMNHPDGNCPLCLCPLVPEEEDNSSLPYMKLMSCFHCFHSECITSWWKWLQVQNETNHENSRTTIQSSTDEKNLQDKMANCPVCRKVFHTKDIEHVINLAGSYSTQLDLTEKEVHDGDTMLQSDLESSRRQKFEAILQLQKEYGGLIEPRKDGVLFASVRPELLTDNTPEMNGGIAFQQQREQAQGPQSSGSSNRASKTRQQQRFQGATMEQVSQRPSPSQYRKTGMRKDYRKTSKAHVKQYWTKKERGDD